MLKLKGQSLIKRMYFSSDSRTLLTIGQNVKYVTVWELQKGKVQRKIPMPSFAESGPAEKIDDIALCHPNRLFAWTDNPYLAVRSWNLENETNTPDNEFVCPLYFLYAKPICNQSKLVFLGRNEQLIYDPLENTNQQYRFVTPAMNSGTAVNFDGTIFAVWEYSQVIQFRKLQYPDIPPVMVGLGATVEHMRFHPSQNFLAVAFARSVQVFDATTGQPVSPRFFHEKPVNQVEFTPDGKRLISIGNDSHVHIWDTATYAEIAKYDFGIGALARLAIAPDSLTFAIANLKKEIVVADLDS